MRPFHKILPPATALRHIKDTKAKRTGINPLYSIYIETSFLGGGVDCIATTCEAMSMCPAFGFVLFFLTDLDIGNQRRGCLFVYGATDSGSFDIENGNLVIDWIGDTAIIFAPHPKMLEDFLGIGIVLVDP